MFSSGDQLRQRRSFFDSRLNLVLTLLLLAFITIRINGYQAFRSDHQSQIPLLFQMEDPTLFPKDWFLQNYSHIHLRLPHVLVVRTLELILGLPLALFAGYLLYLFLLFGAWANLSRRLSRHVLPGLIATAICLCISGQELGSNNLIESILIPRGEAMVCAFWGLALVVGGRPILAGLLFGLAGIFQPAIGIQFAVPVGLWVLLGLSGRPRWEVLRFSAAFILPLAGWLLWLKGTFVGSEKLPDDLTMHLAAFIRHPHHMLPGGWGRKFLHMGMMLAIFFPLWWGMRRRRPRVWRIGWLVPIIVGLLAVATFFIMVVPVKSVVLFQPYRMSLMIYFVIGLVVAHWIMDRIRHGGHFGRFRALVLIASSLKEVTTMILVPTELLLRWGERRRPPWPLVGGLLIWVGAVVWAGDVLKDFRRVGLTLLLFYGWGCLVYYRTTWDWRRTARWTMIVILAGQAAWVSLFFWWPQEQWSNAEGYRPQMGKLYEKYEFNPVPIWALERLAVWARENTPRDALFIIPPGRQEDAFGIWARRSIVFNVKFFPFNPEGMAEWYQRYLAFHGALHPERPEEAGLVQAALNDRGAEDIDDAYNRLSADQMMELVQRFQADYVISETAYRDPRLTLMKSDFDRQEPAHRVPVLHLYAVKPTAQESVDKTLPED